ncbi:DUF2225 domain-containing protein [Sporosarcina sp. Te-1]|uniref:DUF2225 domain-containing protein n=1 Tax=Sporosarcina sp. Te-1 TaxID=2818390 RepID=UPI001A9D352B|nr:DUF2225 domain-containing protein [Sporosarcina sp. Te-1]QTD42702.1 DUF2225 domain-containing protein [Sporosarcina sp. Te-1]
MEINPTYEKKIECLHCKEKFTTTKIRSRFVRVIKHESDFKPIYNNLDLHPLYYNVAVCPHCGFSFTEDFTPYFGPGVKEEISQTITSLWSGRSFGSKRTIDEAIESYKLAYLSASIKKEKSLTMAGITLRIAWLYKDKGDEASEIRFKAIARDLYTESYSNGDYTGTQMSETRVVYLIAELSWQIGDPEEAIRNFSRVIENQRTSTEPHVIQLAKDRWQEIRELKAQP